MQNDYIDATAAEWTPLPTMQPTPPTMEATQWDQTTTFMPPSMPSAAIQTWGYEGAYAMGNNVDTFQGGQYYQGHGQLF